MTQPQPDRPLLEQLSRLGGNVQQTVKQIQQIQEGSTVDVEPEQSVEQPESERPKLASCLSRMAQQVRKSGQQRSPKRRSQANTVVEPQEAPVPQHDGAGMHDDYGYDQPLEKVEEAYVEPDYNEYIKNNPGYVRGQIVIRAGLLVIVTALFNEPTINGLPIVHQLAGFTQVPVRDVMATIALTISNERAQYANKLGMKRETRTWAMAYVIHLAVIYAFLYAVSLHQK